LKRLRRENAVLKHELDSSPHGLTGTPSIHV
jgi:hypothetical protein